MRRFLQENLLIFMNKTQNILSAYKVTIITFIIVSIWEAVLFMLPYEYTSRIPFDEYFVSRMLSIFGVASAFVETYLEKQTRWRICGYLFAALIAGIAAFGLDLGKETQIGQMSGRLIQSYVQRFLYGYLLLLCIFIFYRCLKKSGLGFEEYLVRVFHNFAKIFLLYFILSCSAMFISVIIETLLLEDSIYLSGAIVFLVLGMYLLPASIVGFNDVGATPSKVINVIVKYILSIVTVCAMFFVYLYVVKILILWEIPSNEIFPIISFLFCLGMPVWLMAENYADGTRYSYMLSKLPYIFAPLISLQCYSIGVRIYEYGMTPERYIGVLFILFEVMAVLAWHFGKGRRDILVLIAGALVTIACFLPGVNMYRASNLWQKAYLVRYYQDVNDGRTLSGLEYKRLVGAYEYLKKNPEMSRTVETYDIFEEEFAKNLNLQNEEEMDLTQYETYSVHCCQMVGELDIRDYTKLSMLNQSECYNNRSNEKIVVVFPTEDGIERIEDGEGVDVDFSRFQFIARGTGEAITVDLNEFVRKCMAYEEAHPDADSEEESKEMKPYSQIRIDDETILWLNHFECKYQKGMKDGNPYFEWRNINVSGILLRE